MNKHKLRELMTHLQSIPHYPHPPKIDYDFTGYQEPVESSLTTYPDYFSMDYHCDILHEKSGDIMVGDLAAHGLVMQNCFTGVPDEPKGFRQHVAAFATAFAMPSKVAWELAWPHLKDTWRITSAEMARALGKALNGGTLVYHLWDHVFDRCPMTEIAHAGYDLEVRKQWEGFDSLPWYLRDGEEGT